MNNIYSQKNQKGFTLIELLVVISIIALLSSVVLAGLSTARERARITRAKLDILTIVNAFEAAQITNPGVAMRVITNNNWTAGSGLDTLILSLERINTASGNLYPGLKNINYDPGGRLYLLDENESENANCTRDRIESTGLRTTLIYNFKFVTQTCLSSTTITSVSGFNY